MEVKLFGSKNCPLCSQLQICSLQLKDIVKVEYYDVDTREGLAESAYWEVIKLPTILIISSEGEILNRYEGEVPPLAELKNFLIHKDREKS
jgi:hypothetical protein